MSDRSRELARRTESSPWNRAGTDKTWVLQAMWEYRLFQEEVRNARRVAPD
jgi:hypothetical protein